MNPYRLVETLDEIFRKQHILQKDEWEIIKREEAIKYREEMIELDNW